MAEPRWIIGGTCVLALVASLLGWAALQDGYVRLFLEVGAVGFLC